MTLAEAEARRAFRAARAVIPNAYQAFFDRVVLEDVPIYRSHRLARCSRPMAERKFQRLAQKLAEHCEEVGLDLHLIDRSPA